MLQGKDTERGWCGSKALYIIRNYLVQTSDGLSAILSNLFRGFSQSHQAEVGIVPKSKPRQPHPNTYQFTIHDYVRSNFT
jgi:hypothetical protein